MTLKLLAGPGALAPSPTNAAKRTTARVLYASVAYPEASYDDPDAVAALREEIVRHNQTDAHGLASKQTEAASWAQDERNHYRALLPASTTEPQILQRRAALGCAPLALVSGAWLQWATEPG